MDPQTAIKGKKMFLSLVLVAFLLNLLVTAVFWTDMVSTSRNIALIKIFLFLFFILVAYRGNERARLFLGLMLLMSGFVTYKYFEIFMTLAFKQKFYVFAGVIYGLAGLIIISSTSIKRFVEAQRIKRTPAGTTSPNNSQNGRT